MPDTLVNRILPISVKQMNFATGTWTYTLSSGIDYMLKTATDETSTVSIPLFVPRQSDQHGVKLKSIKCPIRVTTADLDAAPTAVLSRVDYDSVVSGASGDVSSATITTTNDGTVTADANDRLLTVTVSSPALDYSTEAVCGYNLTLTLNAAATSVVRVYSAFALYEELV